MSNAVSTGDYEAQCSYCGWEKLFKQSQSCGLKIGDTLFEIDDEPDFNRCNRCKRQQLIITTVPLNEQKIEGPEGFWKVQTE